MKFLSTHIPGLMVIEPKIFEDQRGFFMETWQQKTFKDNGIDVQFVQDNHSRSTKGILRGLHYQVMRPQGKLVRVIRGEVFDVAVDLRRSSPTYGQWHAEVLSESNRRLFWVPPGFAHGFYVTSDEAEFVYKCTDFYYPQYERCLKWDDPTTNISWPLIDVLSPILSEKDRLGLQLSQAEAYG